MDSLAFIHMGQQTRGRSFFKARPRDISSTLLEKMLSSFAISSFYPCGIKSCNPLPPLKTPYLLYPIEYP